MDIVTIKKTIEQGLNEYGLSERNITYASLIIEEILLLYKCDLDNTSINIDRNKTELSINIEFLGNNITPRELEENAGVYLLDNTIGNTNFILKHNYINGKNIINLSLERYFSIFNNMKFGISFLKNDKKDLFLSLLFNIVAVIFNVLVPFVSGKLIVFYTNNIFNQIVIMALLLLVCRTMYNIFYALANTYYNKITFTLYGEIQTEMLDKLFSITDEKLETYGSGHFIQRINSDAMAIAVDVPTFFNIISLAIYYAAVFVASLFYDEYVFIGEIIIFTVLFFLERKRTKRLDINKRKALRKEEEHSQKVFELVSGANEIKIMNAKKYFIDNTSKSADKVAELNTKTNTDNAKLSAINNVISNMFFFIILVYLGYALHIGRLQVSDTLVLFNYVGLVSMPLVELVQRFMEFEKNFAISCERANSLLEGNEFTKEVSGNLSPSTINGDIEFKHVSFAYTNSHNKKHKKVLNNISFKIKAGEIVSIVGKSGSGKSTILRLITGQRNPGIGLITIDGQDIMKINKDALRSNMSVISQTPFIFNTTIKDNLLMAKPDATQNELKQACKKACIYDDIMETENGFDTVLDENGVRFSGGQRQRLAIARALLRNNKIILLDEATSSVDNASQQKIMSSINNLSGEYTIIMVAHRLSTIVDCDNILLLENGKIVSQGKHKELIKKSPTYKQLFNIEN